MTEPIRFPAQLPFFKWPSVSNVFGLMQAGDWTAVQKAYEDQKGNVDDSIGAGNYWWEMFTLPQVPIVQLPDCPGGSAIQTLAVVEVGKIYTTRALAAGGFSWSVSSGTFPLLVGVGDKPGSFATAGGGNGGSAILRCQAGQYCSMALAEGTPQQTNARYSIDSSQP